MKTFLLLIRLIIAIILLTIASENVSKPSNLYVFIGIVEAIIALVILYYPVKLLISKIK